MKIQSITKSFEATNYHHNKPFIEIFKKAKVNKVIMMFESRIGKKLSDRDRGYLSDLLDAEETKCKIILDVLVKTAIKSVDGFTSYVATKDIDFARTLLK